MVRTQVQLPDAQIRRLRRVAKAEGISVSEAVRRYIERGLEREGSVNRWQRALDAAGAFRDSDDKTDVSGRHDAYLADAYR